MDGEYFTTSGSTTTDKNAEDVYKLVTKQGDNWTDSVDIAAGIMVSDARAAELSLNVTNLDTCTFTKDGKTTTYYILDKGHNYSLEEGAVDADLEEESDYNDYSFEFTTQTVRPMLVDNEMVYFVLKDKFMPEGADEYKFTFAGDTNSYIYYPASKGDHALIGTNHKTSELDIIKRIDASKTDKDSDELDEETFTYNVSLTIPGNTSKSARDTGIYYTIYTPATEGEVKDENTSTYSLYGYKTAEEAYTFGQDVNTNGTNFIGDKQYKPGTKNKFTNAWTEVKSKDGTLTGYKVENVAITINRTQVIRFSNLPSGTTYTIEEVKANGKTLASQGYSIQDIYYLNGSSTDNGSKITGEITEPNKRYYNKFVNTLGSVDADLKVKKILTGRDWEESDSFTFTLTPDKSNLTDDLGNYLDSPMPLDDKGNEQKSVTAVVTDETTDYTAVFGRVRYTKVGTYNYKVTETVPSGAKDNVKDGITYPKTAATISVVVKKTTNGVFYIESKSTNYADPVEAKAKTETTPAVEAAPASVKAEITNVYKAEGTDEIEGEKTLDGDDISDRKFEFEIKYGDKVIATVDNLESSTTSGGVTTLTYGSKINYPKFKYVVDGSVVLGENETSKVEYGSDGSIIITVPNKNSLPEHEFTITEKDGRASDVLYSETSYTVKVTAEADESDPAKLTVTASPDKDLDFVNSVPNKEVDKTDAAVGETVTYTISFMNVGSDGTMTVVDTMSKGLEYTAGKAKLKLTTKDSTGKDTTNESALTDPEKSGSASEGTTLTWKDIEIASGAKAVITFEAVITADAVDNKATNSAKVDNKSTNTVNTNVPEKHVYASDTTNIDGKLVGRGETLTYEIEWSAADGGTVSIVDTLPAGVTVVDKSISDKGVYDSSKKTITWTLGSEDEPLAAGSHGKVSFNVTVNSDASDTLKNTATVNNVEVKAENKTPVKKETIKPTELKVGNDLNYTITFKNTKGDKASASVVDTMTNGLDYVKGSALLNGNALTDPTVTGNASTGETLTWSLTELAKDAEVTVTFKAKITKDALATVTNSAKVDNHSTNDVTSPTTPENTKDVAKGKDSDGNYISIDGDLVSVGDTLTYVIDWTNSAKDKDGNPVKADVTVTDAIPAGTTFVNNSANPQYASYEDGVLTWEFKNQEAGKRGTITFQVTVNEDALENDSNKVVNTATVKSGDSAVSTNTTTNYVPEKDVFGSDASVSINGRNVSVGDKLTYQISYRNTKDDKADVVITDDITSLLEYVEFERADNEGVLVESSGVITWTLKDVPAGSDGTVSFAVKVKDAAAGETLENTASVKVGDDPAVNTNTTENPVPEKDVFGSDSGVSINGKLVGASDELTYEISYKNGHDTKADVTIKDDITDLLKYVEFVKAENNGSLTGNVITWVINSVEAGSDGTVSFKVKVKDTIDGTTLENKASVKVGDDPAVDTNTTENPTPKKEETTDPDELKPGETVLHYVITFTNTNGSDGTAVIADTMSKGLDYVKNSAKVKINSGEESASEPAVTGSSASGETLKWKIEHLAENASVTIAFDALVTEDAEATVDNTASVDNHSTNTVTSPTKRDHKKDVTKKIDDKGEYTSIDGQLVSVGDELIYVIDWTNNATDADGNPAVSDIVITDTIPKGTSYVNNSADPAAKYDEDTKTLTWTLTNQAAGTQGRVTFRVKVEESASGTTVENTASVNDGKNTTNTNTVTNPVPEKDVVKSGSETSINGQLVKAGDELTYRISYQNGHETKADVVVKDNIKELLAYVDFKSADKGGALSQSDGIITWTLKDVPAGSDGTVSFTVKVKDAAAGETLENTASVKAGDDPEVKTNTTENPVPEKDVVKTGTTASINGKLVGAGDELTYRISYKNSHDEAADVVITDDIKDLLEYVTFVSADHAGALSDGVITWTLKNAAAGESGTVSFKVTVKDTIDGTDLENTASVKVGDDPAVDTNTTENPTPKKTETTNPTELKVGMELTYEITFKNTESDGATAVISDTLDAGLKYVENSASVDVGKLKSTELNGKTVTWNLSELKKDETVTLTFKAEVTKDALATVDNTASVNNHSTNTVTSPTTPENTKDVSNGEVDENGEYISIDGQMVGIGDDLTYVIDWTNGAKDSEGNPVDATVTITDTIPEGTTYVSGSADNNGSYVDGVITWSLENQPAGQRGRVTFKVTVNEEALELADRTVKNKASVTSDNYSAETNEVTNTLPGKDVYQSDDLETSINGRLVSPEDELTYVISYSNSNAEEADVLITDDITALLDYVEFVSADNDGVLENGVITWTLEDVDSGEEGNVSFTVKVKDSAAGETLKNSASVTVGDGPSVTTNTTENPVPEKDVFGSDSDVSINGKLVGAGEELTYRISYTNGHEKAADVIITDNISELLEYAAFVSADNGGKLDGKTVKWTLEDVEAGKSGTVSFTVKVKNSIDGSDLENTATVKVGDDPAANTNPVSNPTPVKKETKQPVDAMKVGDQLHYEITFKNTEGDDATAVVKDMMDAGLAYVEDSAKASTGTLSETTVDGTAETGETLTWTVSGLKADEKVTVSFDAVVTEDALANVDNNASVNDHPTNTVTSPTKPENKKDVMAEDESGKLVSIDNQMVSIGDTLTYVIDWSNGAVDEDGNYIAGTVVITDVIPEGTTYVEDSASDNGSYSSSKNTITWSLENQPAGKRGRVTFQVTVDENAVENENNEVKNTASVSSTNYSDTTNTVTNTVPEKDVFDSSDPETSINGQNVKTDQELTYVIRYFNGEKTASDVTVTDDITDLLQYADVVKVLDGGVQNGNVITWNVKGVPAGTAGTVSFSVKVKKEAGGNTLVNTASVKVGENGSEVKTNTTENPVDLPEASKDVFLSNGTVSINGKNVGVGEMLKYEISYSNNENEPQTVVITDDITELLNYAEFVQADNGGALNDGVITWTLADVEGRTSGKVGFLVKVKDSAAGETLTNTANVAVGDNPAVETNTTENPVPGKKVLKESEGTEIVIDNANAGVGDNLVYEITFRNAESKSVKVEAVDTIPEHTSFVEGSVSMELEDGTVLEGTVLYRYAGETGYTAEYDAGKTVTALKFVIPEMPSNTGGTVRFSVTVTDDAGGERLENTAKVIVGEREINTNQTVNPVPEKNVYRDGDTSVTIDNQPVTAGDVLQYVIDVENAESTDTEYVITDEIPEYTEYVEGSADHDGVYEAESNSLQWTVTVPAGEKISLSFKVTVTAGDEGTVVNTAKVLDTKRNLSVETNTAKNPPAKKDVFESDADMEAEDVSTLSIDGQPVETGEELLYRIDYENVYDGPISIAITDSIPKFTEYVEGSVSDNGVYDNGMITWNLTDVPAGAGYVTFKVKVLESGAGRRIENAAELTYTHEGVSTTKETNTTKNPVPKKDVFDQEKDPGLYYSIDSQPVNAGDVLTYQISYDNVTAEETVIVITDEIPENTTYVEGSASDEGTYENGTVSWEMTVPAGTKGSVTFQVKVNEDVKSALIENTAVEKYGENGTEKKTNTVKNPVYGKDVKRDGNSVDGQNAAVGQTLTYTISYVNGLKNSADVTVTDDITELMQYVEDVQVKDSGKLDGNVITWIVEDVPSGESGTVSFTVTLKESAAGNTLENTAEVLVGDDPDMKAETNTVTNPVPKKDVFEEEGTVSINGDVVKAGDVLRYEISYTNGHTETADVTVTDDITSLLLYVDDVEVTDGVLNGNTITWNVKNVQAGKSGTVSFTAKVKEGVEGNKLVNTASVSVGDDPAVNTNTVSNPTENPAPEKDVFRNGGSVSFDGKTAGVGDELTYEIRYTNSYEEAVDVTVTDDIADLLQYAEVVSTENGELNGSVITWNVSDVPAGESGSVKFTVKVKDSAAGNTLENTASVTVGDNPAADTNTVSNPVPKKDVRKSGSSVSIDGNTVSIGDELTYVIEFVNGHEETADVTVTDDITDLLQYAEDVEVAEGTLSDGVITWIVEDVPAGESGSVSFTVKVKDSAAGNTLENTASVSVGSDPAVKTNTVENPVNKPSEPPVNPPAESPKKTVYENDGHVNVDGHIVDTGDELTYEISYQNSHPSAADVVIEDDISKMLKHVDLVSVGNDGVFDENTGVITWTLEDVPSGEKGTVTFKVRVKADALGNKLTNTAAVRVGDDPSEVTNTTENPVRSPDPKKDVFMKDGTLSIDGQTVSVGDELRYEISCFNSHEEASDIAVRDNIRSLLKYAELVSVGENGQFNALTGVIKWNLEDVPAGESVTVSFVVKVKEKAAGNTLTNTAYVSVGDDPEVETNTVNNPVEEEKENPAPVKDVYVNGSAVSSNGQLVGAGDELTYEIRYTNGKTTAQNVTITDNIRSLLLYAEFVSADNGGSLNRMTGVITWTAGSVQPGVTGSVHFTVRLKDSVGGETLTNTASVTIGDDPAVKTNTTENPTPKKDVFKKNGTSSINGRKVSAGDELTYRISYRNTDSSAAKVVITDDISELLKYADFMEADQGGLLDISSGTVSWVIENAVPGVEGTVSFTVRVKDSAAGNRLTNQAQVQIGDHPAVKTNTVENNVPQKTRTIVPDTSDPADMMFWMIQMLASIAACLWLYRKQKSYRSE